MDKKDNRSSEREPEGNSFDYEELVNEPAEDQDYEEYREEDDFDEDEEEEDDDYEEELEETDEHCDPDDEYEVGNEDIPIADLFIVPKNGDRGIYNV